MAGVKKAGALPALHGPVTFVLVPTAGPQPQLGQAQKNYLKAVWTALLTAAGATSVTFIDASGRGQFRAPSAPTVAVPGLPATPIPPVHRGHNKVTCTVPASYFVVDTPKLIDAAQTKQDLTPCINAALAAHATFALDGWTSYEGPLNASGKPAVNYAVQPQAQQGQGPDHCGPSGPRPRSAQVRHHPPDRARQRSTSPTPTRAAPPTGS